MSFVCDGILPIVEVDVQMVKLYAEMRRLSSSTDTVRLELRRNGGHKGKVDNKVLLWLDHVDQIELQFTNICYYYFSLRGLVRFIRISPTSVLVFFASSKHHEDYKYSGNWTLLFPLVEKIRDKILDYLDDPLIRTIGFYGGQGWVEHSITEQYNIASLFDKTVRVKLFHKTSLKNLQRQIRKHEDAEVNKCLIIFDYDRILKPGLLNTIKTPIRNLYHIYSGYTIFKSNKHILHLTNEVKVLLKSNTPFQGLYDEGGAHSVPAKFTTHKTLTGQLTREASGNIWEYLFDPMIGTIGIYGIGGVGKTTVMKNICNELGNTDHFDIIIWVSLSKVEVYNYMRRLQDEVAMQLGLKLLGSEDTWERACRISEKLKIVGKCLFILDDLSEMVHLSAFGIPYPDRDNGCKVVLTTRIMDVCMKMNVQKMIYLAPLSDKEAWDLFVSKSGDQVLDPKIESIARKIVYECGGLPLTIIAVSHVMKDEPNIVAWRLALKELKSNHSRIYGEGMDHLFDVLIFCYQHLKDDQLRLCFLHCAIFPEDYKFESAEVIRYWMAENLIPNKGCIVESINDGLKILKELRDANMLEIFMEGGIEWLKMHDLFRDLAIIITRVEHDFLVEAGTGLHGFPLVKNEKMSLINNSILNLESYHYHFLKLSTLLLRDNPLDYFSYSFFSSMPNLQVLDMSYSGLKELPPSISELHKLRVLFLDFCTGIEKLPSLGKLKDLRFLNLRGTLIKELPEGIERLVNLVSLDLCDTIRLSHIKAGVISSLSTLEELQLQGSRLCKMESPEAANLLKEISCLKQLGILTLSTVGFGDPLDTILHLQQHNLKSFTINAYGSTLDYMEDV